MLSEKTLPKTHPSARLSFNKQLFEGHTLSTSGQILEAFKQIARQYALFHIAFFSIGLLELFAFVLFFSFLTQSAIFAFTIAALFFTGFAYFVLLFYFQAKKPQQLFDLQDSFLEQCNANLPFNQREYEYHTARIHALYLLLSQFHRQEYSFYTLSEGFKTLSLLAKKFSVWTHWKDVHQFKEILLKAIVKEYVHLVQLKPTDLEVHAGLATVFVSLTKLYMDPRKTAPEEEHLWVSPEYHSESMDEKFKSAALRAIEELRILDAYAPNDPWVHSQLASVYQDLGEVDKEIEEYEAILKLSPKDHEILFRLGALYFSQGRNAPALSLYEKLKELSESKAEELLSYYGAAFMDAEEMIP
jgi:tetratricopeptide (TPR) repeat protein